MCQTNLSKQFILRKQETTDTKLLAQNLIFVCKNLIYFSINELFKI